MTQIKKAAIYVRANTPSETFRQTIELTSYAQSKGYEITSEVYIDEIYTKYPLQRPALTSLLMKTFFSDFDADVILVESPDRLSRSLETLSDILNSLKPKQVIFTNTKGAKK